MDADPFVGEVTTLLAKLDDGDLVLVLAGLAIVLFDLPFDRQTVAIPPRHVVRVFAHHLLRAIDDVLQDFVERGTDMEMAVGVRRAIVQDELLAAAALLAQPLVELHLGPALEELGLALGQAGTHREVRLGQKDGRFIVLGHRGNF